MTRTLAKPRLITADEAAVVKRALENFGFELISKAMLQSIDSLEVVSQCGCGCDSIDFRGFSRSEHPEPVAACIGESTDGARIYLNVLAARHRVVSLEVFRLDGEPARLPRLDSMRVASTTQNDAAV